MPLGSRDRAVGRPIDIDMGVATGRSGAWGPRPEHGEAIAHRGAAQMLDRDADIRRLRISEAGEEPATALDHEADDRARRRVEQPRFDQDRVHRRIEQRVLDDVVEMAVGVVVAPPGRERHETREAAP